MRFLMIVIAAVIISACDGTNISTNSSTTSLDFTSEEITNSVLISTKVLKRDSQDGFIILFDSDQLTEIGFVLTSANAALYGDYPWTIVNNKIQVTYPSSIICTTTKDDVVDSEIMVTSVCDGGTPVNATLSDSVIKPASFDSSDLSGRTITITTDTNQEVYKFNNDSTFTLNISENGNLITSESGTYDLAKYDNTVRLEFPASLQYGLLVLADGSLTSGLVLDLRFSNSFSTLDEIQEIRFYTISENNVWRVDELFNSFNSNN